MWNRSQTPVLPHLTPLFLALLLYLLTSTVASGSPSPYVPVENIPLNCGSSGNSTALDGSRTWIGDVDSRFSSLEQSQNQRSLTFNAVHRSPYADPVPYATARLSTSAFNYTFQAAPGQKFIRLYFYPASYGNFDRSKALFSVKAGRFTLLSNFNTSLAVDADADPMDTIFKEYCVNVGKERRLDITFTPSDSHSYAFINGIEILSMPLNLYHTPSADRDVSFIGQQSPYDSALEMVHRVNVGGRFIPPSDDTGLFRSWTPDSNYLRISKRLIQVNTTIELSYTKETPAYTAPEDVYRTAITMGNNKTINKSNNLAWEFSVDSKFVYLVRLHFCEIQPQITEVNQRKFLIFIANQTADERGVDVISWSGGNGVPVKKDYAVSMSIKEGQKKMNLSITLEANPQDRQTLYSDAFLNGVEIFKVSDSHDNLAGSNPDPPLLTPRTVVPLRSKKESKNNMVAIVAGVGGGISGLVVLWILGLLIFRRHKGVKDFGSSDGTSSWGTFSLSKTKSTRTLKPPLACNLCRYFTLPEIRAATNNFDSILVVGGVGFGTVYRGYIDGGANSVAIKRLKSGSQQGAYEFETEIKMLSQFRHLNLVSLVGYCDEGSEMILVLDYMVHGTLRDHLYETDNPPLPWKQRLEICIGAARGLDYLHTIAEGPIIHRDVKTTNILLDKNWVAKVSDFGLSKVGLTGESHVSTAVKGSFGYLDPEYYSNQHLTDKSDVYSFGVVLCEVLCARPPILRTVEPPVGLARWVRENYRDGNVKQMVDPALKGQIAPRCLKKFVEITVRCLLENGAKRPSMNDVLWYLEFALQLQESAGEDIGLELSGTEDLDDDKVVLRMSADDDSVMVGKVKPEEAIPQGEERVTASVEIQASDTPAATQGKTGKENESRPLPNTVALPFTRCRIQPPRICKLLRTSPTRLASDSGDSFSTGNTGVTNHTEPRRAKSC